MSDLIKQEWNSYLERVIPDDAGAVQIVETKRSFYAGAGSCFRVMTDNGRVI